MQRGRRIAFDYGAARIGVAVSDLDSILAVPLTTIKNADKDLSKEIKKIFNEVDPIVVFVGKPALLSGRNGAATEKVMEFVDILRSLTDVPIKLIDERMSTVSAARLLRDAGKNAKDSKAHIDMAAAVAILEFALEIEKSKK